MSSRKKINVTTVSFIGNTDYFLIDAIREYPISSFHRSTPKNALKSVSQS